MKKIIYADHSATTFVKDEVLKEMLPYFSTNYGNASSSYSIGRVSRKAIEKARKQVGFSLNANTNEIYFTSGGSESDNMIIKGIARANKNKGKHIITTKIEHLAVLNTCKCLEKEGFDITYLDVDSNGFVNLDELKKSIRNDTILISVMFVNNEIGTIQPIEEIGRISKELGIFFHTDAVQAIGNLKIDVKKLNINALSLSAHKFYGPKGVGAIYIEDETNFLNLIDGGHQECGKRAGTENVAGIVGLGRAITLANENLENHVQKMINLRTSLLEEINSKIKDVTLNGDLENRVCGNLNIGIDGVNSETLLLMLDMDGICASSGSACNSSTLAPSHVLKAIGLSDNMANSSIRFTLGDDNTKEDIKEIAVTLKKLVDKIRKKV